ncbi:MAG: ArsC/Spx/MgsR family protein [Flavobacteriaceae bacterium]
MYKIYYLSSCDSCRRILKELAPLGDTVLIDIKTQPLSSSQLEEMRQLAGSYEALFSKRARLYRERGLNKQKLSEEQFKTLILEHYTFLKRPVMIFGGNIFIGNSAKIVAAAKETLHA